jgi:uncharacterized membrane protein
VTKTAAPSADKAWALVEEEKRRDRFLRRVSVAAWSTTFVVVLLFAVLIGMQVWETLRRVAEGRVPMIAVVAAAMPLMFPIGIISLLVATLSTVGIFLRLRTASLVEIQLRLAALEDIVSSRPDSES